MQHHIPTGIYTIGQLTGAFPASYLPDRIGRRWAMVVGNVILGSYFA